MAESLPAAPRGKTLVLGAGKAAASMAREIERRWDGELDGLVVTRYGHGVPCERIRVVEAAHPVPDQAGADAAAEILQMATALGEDDHLIFLASGGASALLSMPLDGISLEDKQALNRALLASGADIHQMNAVRKHLSAIKGGRLAAACYPASSTTLLISDVPGDDPATVGSGPTVADPTTLEQARAVLDEYNVEVPASVEQALNDLANETPKPGDPRLANAKVYTVATAQDALSAAAEYARAVGITPVILGDTVEGEAREVALVYAGLVRQIRAHGHPFAAPCVLLSGGETTVTVRGDGRGGRNAEFMLAFAAAMNGLPGVFGIACDTDGIDGTEDNAGCMCGPTTLTRARDRGFDAAQSLANNDGYRFFDALGDLVMTGPTLTNVNDFRALLILPE